MLVFWLISNLRNGAEPRSASQSMLATTHSGLPQRPEVIRVAGLPPRGWRHAGFRRRRKRTEAGANHGLLHDWHRGQVSLPSQIRASLTHRCVPHRAVSGECGCANHGPSETGVTLQDQQRHEEADAAFAAAKREVPQDGQYQALNGWPTGMVKGSASGAAFS